MITLKNHNLFDYGLGSVFLVSPYIFGLSDIYFAQDVFMVLGIAIIGYSLLTDYPYSIFKALPASMHMTFDGVIGIFTILAPWIYGYQEELTPLQLALHWALGISALTLMALTERGLEPPTAIVDQHSETLEEIRTRPKQAA